MLKQLRHKNFIKYVLWAVIIAFVFTGASTLGEKRNYAGIVFGKKVSLKEYSDAWDAIKNEALMTYGGAFYEIAEQLDLDHQAWERIISLHEVRRRKIRVSDEEVRAYIASVPFFQSQDGAFDQQRYEIILSSTFRIDARKFEENMRDRLGIAKLVQDAIKDISVSEEAIDEEIKREEELPDKPLKDEPKPEGAEEPKEETPEEKRERVKNRLLMQKRFELLQAWQGGLRQKAGLVDNISKLKAAMAQELPPEDESPVEEPLPEVPRDDTERIID